jgi:C-terminal processing protease CtpA/Prc
VLGLLTASASAQEQVEFPLRGEGGGTQVYEQNVPPAPRVAWLGLGLADRSVDSQPAVFITHVHPGGPADKAGLVVGDRILRIGDAKVASRQAVVDTLATREPGAVVSVTVQRDGAERQVDVTLGNRSDYIRDATQCTTDDADLDDDVNSAGDAQLLEENRRLMQMLEKLQQQIAALQAQMDELRKAAPAPAPVENPTP